MVSVAVLGGLLQPAAADEGGGAERPESASSASADDAARGKEFWEDDVLPPETVEQKASKKAVTSGQRVEVGALTTETGQVFANPDGTFTAETSSEPQRVRKGNDWVPIDTTLVPGADGTVVPKAGQGLTLSGGGTTAPLVRFTQNHHTYQVFSPWQLPAPELDGSHAVYKSVLPDVDLVVQVQPDGFTQNLVVHTSEAAANPALKSINYPVKADGLQVRSSANAVSLVDDGGRPVFISSAPLMWDSGDSAGTHTMLARTASEDAPAVDPVDALTPDAQSRTAVADVSAADDELKIIPDQRFLQDPKTTYPVVIDPPTVKAKLAGWTTVWSTENDTSFWNTTHALGVGYDAFVDNKKARSLFQFDTRTVAGKKILHAQFSAYEIWSANCTKKDVDLYRTGPISSGTKWGKQPSWSSKVDTVSTANGFSSDCKDASVEFDATSAVAYTAKAKSTTTTLGLRADEGDPIAWKQFMSPKDSDSTSERKPVLSITYVTPPTSKPSSVKMSDPNVACSSSSSPAVIRDATPRLTATPTSSDGSNAVLRPNFELYTGSSTSPTTLKPSAYTASGTAGTVPTATLKSGTTYHFRARTEYKYSYGGTTGYLYGPWSSNCYFKVDTDGPPKPTITSVNNQYPECAGTTCAGSPETGSVGMTGTFTITAGASDVRRYVTWLNGVKIDDKTYSVNTTSHSVSVTPDKRLTNTLRVQTYDAAGNPGETRDYFFNVARPAVPVGVWKFDEGSGTTAANAQGASYPLTVNNATWDSQGRLGKGIQTNGTTSYAATSGPVVDTTGSFSISAWVNLGTRDKISTVANQNGSKVGAFQLYYSDGYDRWVFNRYAADSDTDSPTITRAISTKPGVVGAWTHLLAVYDRQAQQLRLYVNGELQQQTAFTTPWASSGPFEIGRFKGANGPSSYFTGEIDQVQAYKRVVYPDELWSLANLENADTGKPQAELLAQWAMDETSGTTGSDGSGRDNMLQLQTGAAFTTTDDAGHGNVLELNEDVLGRATSAVKLDDGGSFTVAGWVNLAAQSKLEDTTTAHSPTVFSHPGSQRNAFRLWYRQEAGESVGDWNFGVYATDVLNGPAATTVSDEVNPPGGWMHVVGVYDSVTQSAKLYVTGERQGDEDGAYVEDIFQPTGPLMIGGARRHDTGEWGNALPGQLDDMRVYAGVLSEDEITQLSIVDEPPVDIG
ncbi:LamG-like jellyroll fold domain-containing protein [Streptomyces sp. NPDC047081]|uniref:LamG-like jellyroll fold domain-containing protein n=1 Tax=Streptomyces sp. NPDC047081 TaxID=3154706 RepID=UPI0033C0A82C